MSTQIDKPAAGKTLTPVQQVCDQISRMQGHFQQALPEDVTVDRFTRVVLTTIQQNPDLVNVEDKQSLYNACVRAAQDGLLPNGQEGAMVTFKKNVGTRENPKWVTAAQWMPMVYGLIKRMAKAGIRIEAAIIYKNEVDQGLFKYELGDNPRIEHKPILFGERGEKMGAYVVAHLPDGTKVRTFMRADEIEKVKNSSKTKGFGPWKDWEDEMWIKTVIRRCYKRLPIDDADRWGKAAVSAIKADDENFETVDHKTGEVVKTTGRSESMQAVVDTQKPATTAAGAVAESENPAPAADGTDIFDQT